MDSLAIDASWFQNFTWTKNTLMCLRFVFLFYFCMNDKQILVEKKTNIIHAALGLTLNVILVHLGDIFSFDCNYITIQNNPSFSRFYSDGHIKVIWVLKTDLVKRTQIDAVFWSVVEGQHIHFIFVCTFQRCVKSKPLIINKLLWIILCLMQLEKCLVVWFIEIVLFCFVYSFCWYVLLVGSDVKRSIHDQVYYITQ